MVRNMIWEGKYGRWILMIAFSFLFVLSGYPQSSIYVMKKPDGKMYKPLTTKEGISINDISISVISAYDIDLSSNKSNVIFFDGPNGGKRKKVRKKHVLFVKSPNGNIDVCAPQTYDKSAIHYIGQAYVLKSLKDDKTEEKVQALVDDVILFNPDFCLSYYLKGVFYMKMKNIESLKIASSYYETFIEKYDRCEDQDLLKNFFQLYENAKMLIDEINEKVGIYESGKNPASYLDGIWIADYFYKDYMTPVWVFNFERDQHGQLLVTLHPGTHSYHRGDNLEIAVPEINDLQDTCRISFLYSQIYRPIFDKYYVQNKMAEIGALVVAKSVVNENTMSEQRIEEIEKRKEDFQREIMEQAANDKGFASKTLENFTLTKIDDDLMRLTCEETTALMRMDGEKSEETRVIDTYLYKLQENRDFAMIGTNQIMICSNPDINGTTLERFNKTAKQYTLLYQKMEMTKDYKPKEKEQALLNDTVLANYYKSMYKYGFRNWIVGAKFQKGLKTAGVLTLQIGLTAGGSFLANDAIFYTMGDQILQTVVQTAYPIWTSEYFMGPINPKKWNQKMFDLFLKKEE